MKPWVLWAIVLLLAGVSVGRLHAQSLTPTTGMACSEATPCPDSTPIVAEVAHAGPTSTGIAVGFTLAWVVVGLLAAALLYALIAAISTALGGSAPTLPAGLVAALPVVALIGLGVALYMTFIETTQTAAVCGPIGDCNAVQSSPFARLFGVLPVGLLGAVGYLAIFAAWAFARAGRTGSQYGWLALFGLALFGVLFSLYLTYLELFIIHAVCIWCLSSAVLMALLLALVVRPAVDALAGES